MADETGPALHPADAYVAFNVVKIGGNAGDQRYQYGGFEKFPGHRRSPSEASPLKRECAARKTVTGADKRPARFEIAAAARRLLVKSVFRRPGRVYL
jgi:hypothetical protein